MVATSADCRRRVTHILHRAPPEGAEDSSGADAALPQQPAICVSTGRAIAAVPLAGPVCAGGPCNERGIAGSISWPLPGGKVKCTAGQLDARAERVRLERRFNCVAAAAAHDMTLRHERGLRCLSWRCRRLAY